MFDHPVNTLKFDQEILSDMPDAGEAPIGFP
jgi:hypothetical protein